MIGLTNVTGVIDYLFTEDIDYLFNLGTEEQWKNGSNSTLNEPRDRRENGKF